MGALVTSTSYLAATGQSITGDDLTALTAWCAGVDSALRKMLRPYSPDPLTLTSFVMDAPPTNVLTLPVVPVRTLTSIYLHWGANGEAAAFTADDLLTVNTDYWMPTEPFDGYSRTGIVYRRGWGVWAYERRYAGVGSLAPHIDPNRGAIKVTATCGEASVPDAITSAAVLAVSLLYNRRKDGAPFASESWNGRSQSLAGPFTATAAVNSPDVVALLLPWLPTAGVHCASP
jgi:hypothetical protein